MTKELKNVIKDSVKSELHNRLEYQVRPVCDTLQALASGQTGLQWQKLAGMAMHEDANWDQEVCRLSCLTLAEARAFAAADDRISFFFYVKHYAIMARHQVLHAGDAVFFSGVPTLGTEAGADTFEKPAASAGLVSIAAAPGNSWISIQARLQVPVITPVHDLTYLWPGLRPAGKHLHLSICSGLRPVLIYSAPSVEGMASTTGSEAGWWVAGQYLHTDQQTETRTDKHTDKRHGSRPCFGGSRMAVKAGDILCYRLTYDAASKTWVQTITNTANKLSVSFPMSLKEGSNPGQEKNIAYFALENLGQGKLGQCLSLFNIIAKVAYPQSTLGQDLLDLPHVKNIALSEDQTSLSIGRIVLYSPLSP